MPSQGRPLRPTLVADACPGGLLLPQVKREPPATLEVRGWPPTRGPKKCSSFLGARDSFLLVRTPRGSAAHRGSCPSRTVGQSGALVREDRFALRTRERVLAPTWTIREPLASRAPGACRPEMPSHLEHCGARHCQRTPSEQLVGSAFCPRLSEEPGRCRHAVKALFPDAEQIPRETQGKLHLPSQS